MVEHKATIHWERGNQSFADNRYSRAHVWKFDHGVEVPASSSPHVVPAPMSNPEAVDPEEAFVASLSSCHMLWFLAIAAKKKFCIDSYTDNAAGSMDKNDFGQFYISRIILRPKAIFSGDHLPTMQELTAMHDEAHKQCYIANSIKSEVICKPVA